MSQETVFKRQKAEAMAILRACDRSGLKYLGEGSTRAVYALDAERVLKVPLIYRNDPASYIAFSNEANKREERLSGNASFPTAKVLSYHITATGLMLLVMERVDVLYTPEFQPGGCELESLPKWALGLDSCQIGYTLSGQLVAYDYGAE